MRNFRVDELECCAIGRNNVLVDNVIGPESDIVKKAEDFQMLIHEFKEMEEDAVQRGWSKDLIDKLNTSQQILKNALNKLFE